MGWQSLTLSLFRRVRDDVQQAVAEATAEELDRRPLVGANRERLAGQLHDSFAHAGQIGLLS